MTNENKNIVKYSEAFKLLEHSLNGESQAPYFESRKHAMDYFLNHGFPTTRDEDWRFTNIASLVKTDFKPVLHLDESAVNKEFLERTVPAGWKGDVIVFIDGWYSPKWSDLSHNSATISINSVAEMMKTNPEEISKRLMSPDEEPSNVFTALNHAFMRDGAWIDVPDNVEVQQPILLLFIATGGDETKVSYPRNLITVGRSGKADIVEYFVSREGNLYLTNVLTEVYLSENAVLNYDKVQNESLAAYHMGNTIIHQKKDSRFKNMASTFGGRLVRNNIEARLGGPGIETTLNGLYMGYGNQHIDNFTFLDHQMPHCDSHELYRGILDDKASGVFSGKIMVRPDAQKTDAKQTNNCLLLSENAKIDAKPQLEIYADDVRCTHGATIGQLDEEAVFYLQSRGISAERAQNLLIYAFAEELIEGISQEPVKELVEHMLERRMEEELHFVK